jgi:hypothetical protein
LRRIKLVIDKNIPIPPVNYQSNRKPKYPIAELGIGDSIFAATRPATHFWQQKTGYKLAVRATVEDNRKGWRIWRVQE